MKVQGASSLENTALDEGTFFDSISGWHGPLNT